MWSRSAVASPLILHLESEGYQVSSPTLPGHSPDNSPSLVVGMSIRDYVDYILAWIRSGDFDTAPILIGHSMGGLIAQLVAAEIEVHATIMLNSAGPAGINHLSLQAIRVSLPLYARQATWLGATRPSFRHASKFILNEVEATEARAVYDGLCYDSARCLSEIAFWWLDPHHSTRIDGPVTGRKLIIQGECDRVITPSIGQAIAARYPEADYVEIPSLGHWIFGEKQELQVYHRITNWLATKSHHLPARDTAAIRQISKARL